MATLMKPLVKKFNDLYQKGKKIITYCTNELKHHFIIGIQVQTPVGTLTCKAMILLCTADLPAKAKVANSVQYNGYFGCNTCTIQGEYLEHNMSWSYDPSATIRSHLSILADAKQAIERSTSVKLPCSINIFLFTHDMFLGMWNKRHSNFSTSSTL